MPGPGAPGPDASSPAAPATTAKRRQNPSLRRATVASLLRRGAPAPPSPITCDEIMPVRGRWRPGRGPRRRTRWQDWRRGMSELDGGDPGQAAGAAKSRLRGAVPGARHEELALAMVRDTVAAVLACSGGRRGAGGHRRPGGGGRGDRAGRPGGAGPAGRRPERGHAVRRATWWPASARHRAVLAGDLPALRPPSWRGAALAAAPRPQLRAGRRRHRHGAADRAAGVPLDPRFGVGSAAAHAASGARPLDRRLAGAAPGRGHRRRSARGAGPRAPAAHTCALLRDLGLAACGSRRARPPAPVTCGHAGHGRDLRPADPHRHAAARRRHRAGLSGRGVRRVRAAAAAPRAAGDDRRPEPTAPCTGSDSPESTESDRSPFISRSASNGQ